jgi:hypothetical protein
MTGANYQIVNYFDVWGNSEDGYEVNNQCYEDIIFLADKVDDRTIIKMLMDLGLLKSTAVIGENILFTNTGDSFEIEEMDGFPLYGLVPCDC